MSQEQTKKQVMFQHVVLRGSSEAVGRQQAEAMKQVPGWVQFLGSGRGVFSPQEFKRAWNCFSRYCPGLNEEIEGLAGGLGIPVEAVVYYAETYLQAGHCSQLAVLPALTAGGQTLVGRSYEFGDTADDFRLCSTFIDGKYGHIGFSSLVLGRGEGMNEHGLIVTHSSGGMPIGRRTGLRPALQDGLQFWALIRAILEGCRTVDEAMQLIADVPICGNPVLIVTDRSGQAALVEIFGAHVAVKRIDGGSPQQYLHATNHFTLPEMVAHAPKVMANSPVRYRTIQAQLDRAGGRIGRETLKELLTAAYPAGLCCHYYGQFFGTLRSMVFDGTAGEVEICFGSPQVNNWHRFDLSPAVEGGVYPAWLPQEEAGPEFWGE